MEYVCVRERERVICKSELAGGGGGGEGRERKRERERERERERGE